MTCGRCEALRREVEVVRTKLSEAVAARKELEGAWIADGGLRTEVERLRAELADLREEIEARDTDLVLRPEESR